MKNRWLMLVLLSIMTGCVVVVIVALWLTPVSGVTKENFDRIEVGMTRAEVEVILGSKAIARIRQRRDIFCFGNFWRDAESGAEAGIEFDAEDHVRGKEWWPGVLDQRTTWERFLDLMPGRPKRLRPVNVVL
ncbi:MAG TPA: hypothetical protein VFE62_01150 [Gemmataceae bacterium]|nr:hypothetical protein [Gemmataceae bacterium]